MVAKKCRLFIDWCPPSCPFHPHPLISQAEESQKQGIDISFGKTVINVVLWWRTICSYCVSRLDRHVTYYSPHLLYICRYSP